MAHLTLIARASDGLPLSSSIVNEESGRDYAEYQPKAKQIFRKQSSVSPPRCSIECDPGRMVFHYILEEGICYLALCDPTYPAKLAFNYLENLHKDFSEQHGNDVHKASRPYHFIEFGTYLYLPSIFCRLNYKVMLFPVSALDMHSWATPALAVSCVCTVSIQCCYHCYI
ncbi:vesicle-trafficking protein SEC22b-like isoform X1 [Halichondria panicea]|uniref:vesicle-trafficking protein SEC22b-like isoform X3 n=1 Tax=Halichondria panicea TaxID=6063 RepID=UPI00312BAE98